MVIKNTIIGNGTVLSPFGGIKYHTETEGMAALIPVLGKETTTASVMTYGYNPLISKWSPYHGAMYAINYFDLNTSSELQIHSMTYSMDN